MQHACHWLVKRKSPHCGRRTSYQAGLLSLELKLLLLVHQHSSAELWGVLRLLAEWNTSRMLSAILWHWLDSQKRTFSILRHWLDPQEKSVSILLHWLVQIPKRSQYITASYNEQVLGGSESCPFKKEPIEWLFHRAKFFSSVRTRKWTILS